MVRTLVRLATVAGAVVALAVPTPVTPVTPVASAAVEDQLTFAALKPDPASRTLAFRLVPEIGGVLDLTWAFGDGTTGSGFRPQHTFGTGAESFTVTLTVTFDSNNVRTISKVVQPGGQAPQLQLDTPPTGATFAAGEVAHASATAPDATEIRWVSRIPRCSPSCDQEYPDPVLGGIYDLPYPAMHLYDGPVYAEVYATSAAGLSSRATFTLFPRRADLRVSALLPVDVVVDGVLASGSPGNPLRGHVGATITVQVPPAALGGAAPFQSWSDGNTEPSRQFVMPDQAVEITADYITPIEARYDSDAGLRSLLGPQTQPEDTLWGGSEFRRATFYSNGRLQWSPATGTHEVHGGIATLGIGPQWPITDELGTPDGVGRYNDFENRWSIYWTPSTGAHSVHGGIGDKWRQYGRELWLGYPTTEENKWMPENVVFQNYSKGGAIYWTATGGAHEMHGGIRAKFDSYGGYPSFGYPTTDETGTSDGIGRFNHFSRGWSIYWTASTGAHEVHGGIRTKWFELGAERSFLRYPTSDELYISGGARQNFQGGYIVWNSSTGVATAYRY